MTTIKRALISVFDKTDIIPFAQALAEMGIDIISSGGTARALREAGIPVVEVSDYTGFPEMMGGRVKTLHPKVHGGILFIRGNAEHTAQAVNNKIDPIDMVVVNLYPFAKTVAKPGCTFAEAIENIDIGGPAMVRSAAKNHEDVTVIVSPGDYQEVLVEMRANCRATTPETRLKLAFKAFTMTCAYDAAISNYLASHIEQQGI